MLSKNTADTLKIAETFINRVLKERKKRRGALVIGLKGDLGAGKTFFVQAIAKHLKMKNKINSPTFVLMKKYPISLDDYKFLFHFDAYRLKNEKELLPLGWKEIIKNRGHLVFIEWPERVSKIIPKNSKLVLISHSKNGKRKFEFK